MERRTFLKFCHQQVSLAWLVRLLLWKFVKTRCLNLLQLFSNQLFVIRLSLPEFIHGGIG